MKKLPLLVRVLNLLPCQCQGVCLGPVIRANGAAPKGQDSLPQGFTLGKPNIRFALKGEFPWAMFSWPLRAMEWKHRSSFEPREAKPIQCQLELQFQMGNTFQERVLGGGIKLQKGPIHTVPLVPETDTDNFDDEHTSRKSSRCRMKQ
jgi:hypothetical protein